MGKAFSIYLGDEVTEFFTNQENKSQLVNRLLSDFYKGDEAYLTREEIRLKDRLEYIKIKKEHLNQTLNKDLEETREKVKVSQQKEEKDSIIDLWTQLWREERITDDFYYMGCDDESLDFIKNKLEDLNIKWDY